MSIQRPGGGRTFSLLAIFFANPQLVRGAEPVFIRRPLRTASRLPQLVSQRRDFIMPEDREAVFIHRFVVRQRSMLKSHSGMLQSLPRLLVAGLVFFFLVGFRGTQVSVGSDFV